MSPGWHFLDRRISKWNKKWIFRMLRHPVEIFKYLYANLSLINKINNPYPLATWNVNVLKYWSN